jgi:hypothetical protein
LEPSRPELGVSPVEWRFGVSARKKGRPLATVVLMQICISTTVLGRTSLPLPTGSKKPTRRQESARGLDDVALEGE